MLGGSYVGMIIIVNAVILAILFGQGHIGISLEDTIGDAKGSTLPGRTSKKECGFRAVVSPRTSNFPSPLTLYDDMSSPEEIMGAGFRG